MEEILKIAEEEALRHCNDIDAAVEAAERRARELPTFEECIPTLITRAIRELIHDCRGVVNARMRSHERSSVVAPTKVTISQAVKDACRSVYLYNIAGRTLGSILGEELPAIGKQEGMAARGHAGNEKLCAMLAPLVPHGKRVKDCVEEDRLWDIFKRCHRGSAKPTDRLLPISNVAGASSNGAARKREPAAVS